MNIERIIGRRFREGDPAKEGGGAEDKAAEEAAAAAKLEEETAAAAKAKSDEEADKIARGDVVDDDTIKAKADDDDDGVKAKADDGDDDGEGVSKAKAAPSTMVPKSRLDTKNRMLSDAQDRIAELEKKVNEKGADVAAAAAATPEKDTVDTKVKAAEKKYADARKDGNVDAELDAMREIRALEKEQSRVEFETVRAGATTDAIEAARYEDVLAVIEEDYPQLNPDLADDDEEVNEYDQDVVDEVLDIQEAFILKGYTKSEALIRAVSYAFPDTDSKIAELSGERDKKAERDAAAKKKAAETAGKQAPDTKDVGKSGAAAGATDVLPDAEKLSEEEFDSLPEATKKRMRGDEV